MIVMINIVVCVVRGVLMTKSPLFIVGKNKNNKKSPIEIERDMLRMQSRALRKALNQMLLEELPEVAKETGLMREAFRNSLTQQLATQFGGKTITLSIAKRLLDSLVPWVSSHWEKGPQGQSFYKYPTTPNTRPYQPKDMIKILKNHYKRNLKILLQRGNYI